MTAAALAVLAAGVLVPSGGSTIRPDLPPNVLLVVTDDQTPGSLLGDPPAMPWLRSQLDGDATGRWQEFPNTVATTPLCCPSRASILTGRYAHATGVLNNTGGPNLDEGATLAVRLQDAGYATALVGKYLNGYPWTLGAYIPPGWDRWVAKRNLSPDTTYANFPFVDQTHPMFAGGAPADYATDLLADRALGFLRSASRSQPWFLLFTPSAPHPPRVPAPRDAGTFAGVPVRSPSERVLNDVDGKPAWVRALPPVSSERAAAFVEERRRERETLLSVDRALEAFVEEIEARGELDRTVILFLTDNGSSLGEHRWEGKRCPYDPCVRTPLLVRSPWTPATGSGASGGDGDGEPLANIDLAPTILDLAGLPSTSVDPPMDGRSFRPLLDDRPEAGTLAPRDGVLLEWAGADDVPPWTAVRTRDLVYIETVSGPGPEGIERELYDLTGLLGPADPAQLENRVDDPRYATQWERLAALLDRLRASG